MLNIRNKLRSRRVIMVQGVDFGSGCCRGSGDVRCHQGSRRHVVTKEASVLSSQASDLNEHMCEGVT